MHQERNRTTVSQLMAQIRELQIRANSLSYARELYDLESRSSSQATHVPDQTSTILSPRTWPRCDSGLPCDTQDGTGITRNVFERPPAQEGLSSAIFNNSKKLASSSQERIVEMARKEIVKWKENRWICHFIHLTSLVEVVCWIILVELHFHNGMMDYPRIPITE